MLSAARAQIWLQFLRGKRAMATMNFLKGHPSKSHLPFKKISDGLKSLSEKEIDLNYTPTEGPSTFRSSLAEFISKRCRDDEGARNDCRKDGIFATGGVSHGLELACSVFGGGPGKIVLAESPSYFLAFDIFRYHGMKVKPIPTDSKGVCIEALENILVGLKGEVSLLYLVPTHSNPSSATMPIERRKKLVSLAAKYNFKILADEVYHLLDWSQSPRPARMAVLDPRYREEKGADEGDVYEVPDGQADLSQGEIGHVLSISAFTKIFCPGVRLGWIEAAPSVISKLAAHPYVQSGGGLVPLQSQVMTQLIISGAQDEHLNSLIKEYKKRAAALVLALKQYPSVFQLDGGALESKQVSGGYFIWVKILPEGIDAKELRSVAQDFQVDFLPGERCYPDLSMRKDFQKYIRLCFAFVDSVADLQEGVHRLAKAVQSLQSSRRSD